MSKVYVFKEYGGPEVEALIDRPVPAPGPGELAVEVVAAGVNPADWKRREGLFGRGHTLPAPMGLEVSGIVTAVGEGVDDFAVGDAVLGVPARGMGAFAEHTLLRAGSAVAKPDELAFNDAATIPVAGTTAYDLTHAVDLEEGATVLILGAGGGVGYMAAQIAAVHKFRVIAVASEAKRALLEPTAAAFVPSGEGFAEKLRRLAPEGVDLLVDLVGGDVLRAAAPVAKDPARIVSAADTATATALGGRGRPRDPETLEKITGVVAYGLVDPHVTTTYPLDEAREALAVVESGHAEGKTVITV